jgi:hypothetical protein
LGLKSTRDAEFSSRTVDLSALGARRDVLQKVGGALISFRELQTPEVGL